MPQAPSVPYGRVERTLDSAGLEARATSGVITTDLSLAELQAALRLAGLAPRPGSPLAQIPPPPAISAAVQDSLRAKHILNGDGGIAENWRSALSTLVAPTFTAAVRIGAAEEWISANYFTGDGGMAGYSATQQAHRITIPCSRADVIGSLQQFLNWGMMPDLTTVESTLSAPEMAVVAAGSDAFREENLRGLLERRISNPLKFSRKQLQYEIQQAASGDPRWLCSLLARYAPVELRPAVEMLNAGAVALAKRGWLRLEGEAAHAEGALALLCQSWANLNPHVFLTTAAANGPQASVLILFTPLAYWVFEFSENIRIRQYGGPAIEAFVNKMLRPLPELVKPPSWDAPPPVPQQIPQQIPQPIPQPIPQATVPMPRACVKCGKQIPTGRAFCSGCGTPV